jgi:hypothetical protein
VSVAFGVGCRLWRGSVLCCRFSACFIALASALSLAFVPGTTLGAPTGDWDGATDPGVGLGEMDELLGEAVGLGVFNVALGEAVGLGETVALLGGAVGLGETVALLGGAVGLGETVALLGEVLGLGETKGAVGGVVGLDETEGVLNATPDVAVGLDEGVDVVESVLGKAKAPSAPNPESRRLATRTTPRRLTCHRLP